MTAVNKGGGNVLGMRLLCISTLKLPASVKVCAQGFPASSLYYVQCNVTVILSKNDSGEACMGMRLSMCSNVSLTVYWYSWQQGVVLVDVEIAQVMHVCRYLTSTEDVLLCDTDVKVIYHLQHLVSCLPLVNVYTHPGWHKIPQLCVCVCDMCSIHSQSI